MRDYTMASKVTESGSESEMNFMNEIVFEYDPRFKKMPKSQKLNMLEIAKTGGFQLSNLLEQAIAFRSNEIRKKPLKNVDIDGMDFDDKSDLKSCSTYDTHASKKLVNGEKKRYPTVKGKIAKVKNKKGAIRVILWNHIAQQIEYYFIPNKDAVKMCNTDENIDFSAPASTGVVKKLQPYRCDSFDDLVMQ
jgi:hypothetical protein